VKQLPRLRRTFLFLQGPHGSFFPQLGAALAQAGHRVRRINLNGGDRATWPQGFDFRGRLAKWPGFVARFVAEQGVTDMVLFGDSRPHHAEAIAIAKRMGVRIHVFEEGYIRPDWVTLERDGVNGHSTLPRDPAWYLDRARGLPPLGEHPPVPSYTTARGWAAFFYYAEVVLQHWRFPFHGSHRDRNPVWEGITFLRRFRMRESDARATAADLGRLGRRRYFLFPLQLTSDYQIRVHSRFGSMHGAIGEVLESFARSAPADTHLVVKEHPLDAGLIRWRDVVGGVADRLGIRDRVAFVEQGDLLALVEKSAGMVTVNSTSGTLSLAAGKAVKVLGRAVYDIDGITDRRPLDQFWRDPRAPDPARYDAFCRVLQRRCLIHGAFLSNAGIDLLVDQATARLTADDDALIAAPARRAS
jgi:capsular polysaccharide export protein